MLRSVAPADGQLFARLGDVIVLTGDELGGTSVSVRLANRRLPVTLTAPATSITDSSVRVTLPSDPAAFPAGIWTAQAVISTTGKPDWLTNELPFGLAPTLTNLPLTVARNEAGTATLALDCQPEVGPDQDCALLLGQEPIALATPRAAAMSTVTFIVTGAAPGTYPVRLRVDGIDSLLVDATTVPPVYDPSQVVVIE